MMKSSLKKNTRKVRKVQRNQNKKRMKSNFQTTHSSIKEASKNQSIVRKRGSIRRLMEIYEINMI